MVTRVKHVTHVRNARAVPTPGDRQKPMLWLPRGQWQDIVTVEWRVIVQPPEPVLKRRGVLGDR